MFKVNRRTCVQNVQPADLEQNWKRKKKILNSKSWNTWLVDGGGGGGDDDDDNVVEGKDEDRNEEEEDEEGELNEFSVFRKTKVRST